MGLTDGPRHKTQCNIRKTWTNKSSSPCLFSVFLIRTGTTVANPARRCKKSLCASRVCLLSCGLFSQDDFSLRPYVCFSAVTKHPAVSLLRDFVQDQTVGIFWHTSRRHHQPRVLALLARHEGWREEGGVKEREEKKNTVAPRDPNTSSESRSPRRNWARKQKRTSKIRKPVCSDKCFHTHQLWRKDPWRYSVVEVLLKLQQLAHEVEVGGDDWPPSLDKLVGIRHCHPGVLHQVGDHNGGWTRYTRLAVNQEAHTCLMCFLYKEEQWDKESANVRLGRSLLKITPKLQISYLLSVGLEMLDKKKKGFKYSANDV